MGFNVAIDGPAGAGKSTVAKAAAKKAGFIYVDTGAMYRAIGLYVLQNETDIHDEEAVCALLPEIDISIRYEEGVQKIILNGADVSGLIRTQEVGEAASVTSAYQKVREKLLELQQNLAKTQDVIMDGRDIGTHVLPNADVKIYLTADAAVRAKRRYDELLGKGEDADLSEIEQEIRERDYRDMHREIAPLRQAEDAVLLDTSDLNIEEATDAVLQLIYEKKCPEGLTEN